MLPETLIQGLIQGLIHIINHRGTENRKIQPCKVLNIIKKRKFRKMGKSFRRAQKQASLLDLMCDLALFGDADLKKTLFLYLCSELLRTCPQNKKHSQSIRKHPKRRLLK